MKEQIIFKDVEAIKCYIRRRASKIIEKGFAKVYKNRVEFKLEGTMEVLYYEMFLDSSNIFLDDYIQDCDAQRHAEDNHSRCQVKGKKGKTVICGGNCNDCPNSKRPDGERIGFRQGGPLSTELMLEDGLDIPDSNNPYERLEDEEEIAALHEAIEQLPDERNQKIAQSLLEDEPLSERAIAEKVGVCQKSVNNHKQMLFSLLREELKEYV